MSPPGGYEFDFTVNLQYMNGSATGECVHCSNCQRYWSSLATASHAVLAYLLPHLTVGDDYEAGPYTVRFSAGQQNATLMVSIMEDNITELSEYFKVVITSTDQPGRVEIGSPNMAFITVEDNDPGVYAHADHANE